MCLVHGSVADACCLLHNVAVVLATPSLVVFVDVAFFVARSIVGIFVARCRCPYVAVKTLSSLVVLYVARCLVRRLSQHCCCIRCYFAVAPCLVRRSIVVLFVALSRLSSRCNIVIVFVARRLLLYCSHR